MTVDDRNNVELIKEAWGAYEYDEGTGWDLVSRLATALEDAVMRIAELEVERDRALEGVADQRRGIARRMGDIAALEVENLDLEARIAEATKLHRPHRDTHKPDPSIIHPNWFCCGAMQLGAIGPMDCNHCRTEWPCPTAVALGLNKGESK